MVGQGTEKEIALRASESSEPSENSEYSEFSEYSECSELSEYSEISLKILPDKNRRYVSQYLDYDDKMLEGVLIIYEAPLKGELVSLLSGACM